MYGSAATDRATVDLYWLGADNAFVIFNGTSGHERRQTVGGRLWRNAHVNTVDFDVAGQFGSLGAESVRAWMISANAGYTLRVAHAAAHVRDSGRCERRRRT